MTNSEAIHEKLRLALSQSGVKVYRETDNIDSEQVRDMTDSKYMYIN